MTTSLDQLYYGMYAEDMMAPTLQEQIEDVAYGARGFVPAMGKLTAEASVLLDRTDPADVYADIDPQDAFVDANRTVKYDDHGYDRGEF